MALKESTIVQGPVRMLWEVGAIGGLTDAQLLERFLAGPVEISEAAFTVVVERHGPAVLRVCRELLTDVHEAQDAAQAAFLVLARKARSIRKPEALGPWLHGVAVRMARRVRAEAARRREVERRGARIMAERSNSMLAAEPELYIELHEEIARLPEKYRSPIVLCHLQGHTQEQASQQLGWPLGTVQTRLHRGRARLRDRLLRRGLGLSGLATTVLVLPQKHAAAASMAVPTGWAKATSMAAVRFAAGKSTGALISPSVVKLATDVLATMLADTARAMAVGMLALGLAVWGVALGLSAMAGSREPRRAAPEAAVEAFRPVLIQSQPARRIPLERKQPDVEQAIKKAAGYLKQKQRIEGSWADFTSDSPTGMTSLVTLALLGADEPIDSLAIIRAVDFLRGFTPEKVNSVYALSLQMRVFAAIADEQDRPRIARIVDWLERAQIKVGERLDSTGAWAYDQGKGRSGDGSNSFYALVGLHAAAEAGISVRPEVWELAARYWSESQRADGGWGYTPAQAAFSTSSMTCEGIVSLMMTRPRRAEGQEFLAGDEIRECGVGKSDTRPRTGIEWLAKNFRVDQNFGSGQQWRFYFLDALEHVGQFSGEPRFGKHDWFREGAEALGRDQSKDTGEWRGALAENDPTLATSFALMFLGRGRAPVLIQKAKHGPADDWDNDPDDVGNLVKTVARDWKLRLNWQIVDLDSATVDDLLLAPILFLNGHRAPELTARGKQALRAFVERGGFIFAEACCGEPGFDRGFRALLKEIFPSLDSQLHPLAADHPVWTARHNLDAGELWGLEKGGKTVLIYSMSDLSCSWNLRDRYPGEARTVRALRLGENVVNYASSRR